MATEQYKINPTEIQNGPNFSRLNIRAFDILRTCLIAIVQITIDEAIQLKN
jgi:hypothetical protein